MTTAVIDLRDARRKVTDVMRTDFAMRYRNGESLSQIARQYDLSTQAVRKNLLKQGVSMRPTGTAAPLQIETRRQARESLVNVFESDVLHDYRNGASIDRLCSLYPDLSRKEIRRVLIDAGVFERVRYNPLSHLSQDMLAVYEETGSATAVAKEFDISPQTALKYVKLAGGTVVTGRSHKHSREERREIARLYALGATTADLAEKYSLNPETIRKYVRSSGVELRGSVGNINAVKIPLDMMQDVRRDYEAGGSGVELAEKYGVTPSTLYSYIRRAGGTVRKRGPRKREA